MELLCVTPLFPKGPPFGGTWFLGEPFSVFGSPFSQFQTITNVENLLYESHLVSENEVQTNGVLC